MDDQTGSVLVESLDDGTRFSYLNYYYQNMLIYTGDEVYARKLDTLYEWWWQEKGFLFYPRSR